MTQRPSGPPPFAPTPGKATPLEQELGGLLTRLRREADFVVRQVESAVAALRTCDRAMAAEVRRRDTEVDLEEVRIEELCLRLVALHQPVAVDLRRIMLAIKVNSDLERIADHASGVAKSVSYLGDAPAPAWPPALLEMAERVLPVCRTALRALTDESEDAARELIDGDNALDSLAHRVFEEVEEAIETDRLSERAGLLAFRASRDLERVGDLCAGIAEDVIYVKTGRIIRHAKRMAKPA
jgi:phosphate transport system protein